ncbi:hypothetical protein [Methanoculleus chikugoensis]|uniref:hypothetical protein n=1 Tax=Methanoculleus chikugoensis TaxID=118126 RepID=UPI001FB2BA56|nr:hypothetical protein [Methanoculleus chikugoensis]
MERTTSGGAGRCTAGGSPAPKADRTALLAEIAAFVREHGGGYPCPIPPPFDGGPQPHRAGVLEAARRGVQQGGALRERRGGTRGTRVPHRQGEGDEGEEDGGREGGAGLSRHPSIGHQSENPPPQDIDRFGRVARDLQVDGGEDGIDPPRTA